MFKFIIFIKNKNRRKLRLLKNIFPLILTELIKHHII